MNQKLSRDIKKLYIESVNLNLNKYKTIGETLRSARLVDELTFINNRTTLTAVDHRPRRIRRR